MLFIFFIFFMRVPFLYSGPKSDPSLENYSDVAFRCCSILVFFVAG